MNPDVAKDMPVIKMKDMKRNIINLLAFLPWLFIFWFI